MTSLRDRGAQWVHTRLVLASQKTTIVVESLGRCSGEERLRPVWTSAVLALRRRRVQWHCPRSPTPEPSKVHTCRGTTCTCTAGDSKAVVFDHICGRVASWYKKKSTTLGRRPQNLAKHSVSQKNVKSNSARLGSLVRLLCRSRRVFVPAFLLSRLCSCCAWFCSLACGGSMSLSVERAPTPQPYSEGRYLQLRTASFWCQPRCSFCLFLYAYEWSFSITDSPFHFRSASSRRLWKVSRWISLRSSCLSSTLRFSQCFPVLVRSLSNVTQTRPVGVHEWLRMAAFETGVSNTYIFASSAVYFYIHHFGLHEGR